MIDTSWGDRITPSKATTVLRSCLLRHEGVIRVCPVCNGDGVRDARQLQWVKVRRLYREVHRWHICGRCGGSGDYVEGNER